MKTMIGGGTLEKETSPKNIIVILVTSLERSVANKNAVLEPIEELEEVEVGANGKKLKVGTMLTPYVKELLLEFLSSHLDCFAWQASDMPEIDPSVITHRLGIKEGVKPVVHKVKPLAGERLNAVKAEVEKLRGAGFIREVIFQTWVANTVLAKKSNDLKETFAMLRKYQMKLNPEKCAFGVQFGKFQGFMITQRDIEANLEKVQAILDMASSETPHDVRKLTRRLAALTRFLAQSGDKCHPFFQALKGARNFERTDECEAAFQAIKDHLHSLPTLAKPRVDIP
ncbi:hypothetical protein CRG98_032473 [Punica granatum]|uniref:Reverse transcriptase/retrotransposon-derived protein RNase H-like domain-containing protein n=1 Tax=Punica granatum TaxID=22663 RepID=A0A2I0ISY9_PUNGR|nr:hypothetical protein CRG98_032473 [Punica granatum]